MARSDNEIAVQELGGSYVDPVALTFTAINAVDGSQAALTGEEILVVRNTDGAAPHTLTISSVADPYGRVAPTANEETSIPADGIFVKQFDGMEGWRQSGGKLFLDTDDVQLEAAVIRFRRPR